MGVLSSMSKKKGWMFAGGVIAGLILPAIAKSDTTRKTAVNATAKCLKAKDEVTTYGKSIKEEAEDVYAEAKHKNSASVKTEE